MVCLSLKKNKKLNFTMVFHKVGQKYKKAFYSPSWVIFSNATCKKKSGTSRDLWSLTNRPKSQSKDLGRFSIFSRMNTIILGTNAVQY